MSLQVWLPLNGDLHNQGLSNITVTNNGATVDNNGKIGKCYSFDGNSYLQASSLSGAQSICFWVKLEKKNSLQVVFVDYKSKLAFGFNKSNYIIVSCVDKNIDMYSDTNFPNNVWTHIALVYTSDNSDILLYINGILQIVRLPGNYWVHTTDNLIIGARYNGSIASYMTGYINDFRIYDHALSAKEVEEIAKGLVLHYKLDQGNPNLLSKYVTPGGAIPGSTATRGRTIYNGDYSIIIPASENADTYFRLFLTQQLIQGKTYTISCYVSGLLNGSYYRFPLFAQGNTSMGVLQLDHNGLCSLTFTMNSSAQNSATAPDGSTVYICFMDDSARALASGQGQITLFGFKLEEGDSVTSWTPSNLMNIIYDSSGYGNNGTIVGSLEASTSSPRYSCATHFTATTSKVLIENLNTSGFANSYSFTWWGKTNTFSNKMFWGFANGVRLNGIYNGNLWNTGDGASNPLYTPGTTTQVTAPSLNSWHHFAMVGNGTTCVVYLDGELWGQAKTYKSISGTKIYMNGWDSGTSYTTNDMSISDFRIYTTALTPEQIKELYNTSMSIDDKGNIHARELVEL